MNHRPFGKTGFHASEIGLGCWQLGGTDWGDLDDRKALDILGAAVDAGVNSLDTADVYGDGRSEELIGRFLRDRSERPFVATKLGRAAGMFPDGYTEAAVRAATEASLRRLGVEALDLTQLHCVPAEVMRQGEVFEWLRSLKAEGLIRDFGASVESVEEALICLEQEGLASLQVNLQRLPPEADRRTLPRGRGEGRGDHRAAPPGQRRAERQDGSADPLSGERPPPLQPGRAGVQRRRDLRGPAV